jgi:hypothetical protein
VWGVVGVPCLPLLLGGKQPRALTRRGPAELVTRTPRYLRELAAVVNRSRTQTLQDYLRWRVIYWSLPHLSRECVLPSTPSTAPGTIPRARVMPCQQPVPGTVRTARLCLVWRLPRGEGPAALSTEAEVLRPCAVDACAVDARYAREYAALQQHEVASTGGGGTGEVAAAARWAVCVSRTERALGFALSRRFVDTSLGQVREPAVPPPSIVRCSV